ncbi:hypothetical protein J4440_00990 [Candidatus Woesearchaeota archaeon]|nr:hypothetical protein [Candidatus Woesearchaeota archaeon]
MTRFLCRNCKFKFSPKIQRNEPPKICGNCGGVNTIEKEPDANDILKEVDNMRDI